MKFTLLAASALTMASVAHAWTACMLDCMGKAVGPAGCAGGSNYNTTACLCLNAQFTSLTRTCFYTACQDDIYPWYNLREAECGSLSSDLTSPQFIPSNSNSTYDKAVAAGSSAISVSSVAVTRASTSAGATSSGGSAAATSAPAAASSAGAAASSRAAGAMTASLGMGKVVLGLSVAVGSAVAGGLLVL